MADSAALLVDEVLPHEPMRQWVLSVPFPLRFVFGAPSKAWCFLPGASPGRERDQDDLS
jgi:hypothetical protein